MSDDFRQTTDAKAWAEAFQRYFQASDDCTSMTPANGLMESDRFLGLGNLIGWFANAIEAGREAERNKDK